eukprot:scaffold69195_cov19-Tisochrysis_lutea.AAC.3
MLHCVFCCPVANPECRSSKLTVLLRVSVHAYQPCPPHPQTPCANSHLASSCCNPPSAITLQPSTHSHQPAAITPLLSTCCFQSATINLLPSTPCHHTAPRATPHLCTSLTPHLCFTHTSIVHLTRPRAHHTCTLLVHLAHTSFAPSPVHLSHNTLAPHTSLATSLTPNLCNSLVHLTHTSLVHLTHTSLVHPTHTSLVHLTHTSLVHPTRTSLVRLTRPAASGMLLLCECRCDPDSLSAPRPVSPCCSPKFVDAHVRDFPYSTRLLPSYSSPLSSPRRMEAPPSPPAVGGRLIQDKVKACGDAEPPSPLKCRPLSSLPTDNDEKTLAHACAVQLTTELHPPAATWNHAFWQSSKMYACELVSGWLGAYCTPGCAQQSPNQRAVHQALSSRGVIKQRGRI